MELPLHLLPQGVQQLILSQALDRSAPPPCAQQHHIGNGTSSMPGVAQAPASLWTPHKAVQLHNGMAVQDGFLSEGEVQAARSASQSALAEQQRNFGMGGGLQSWNLAA
eukprot:scaffold85426_cov20-Tisochrysis_lutea.AAC.4